MYRCVNKTLLVNIQTKKLELSHGFLYKTGSSDIVWICTYSRVDRQSKTPICCVKTMKTFRKISDNSVLWILLTLSVDILTLKQMVTIILKFMIAMFARWLFENLIFSFSARLYGHYSSHPYLGSSRSLMIEKQLFHQCPI